MAAIVSRVVSFVSPEGRASRSQRRCADGMAWGAARTASGNGRAPTKSVIPHAPRREVPLRRCGIV